MPIAQGSDRGIYWVSLTSLPTSGIQSTRLDANISSSGFGSSTCPAKSPYCKHRMSGVLPSMMQTGEPHLVHMVLVIALPLPVSES